MVLELLCSCNKCCLLDLLMYPPNYSGPRKDQQSFPFWDIYMLPQKPGFGKSSRQLQIWKSRFVEHTTEITKFWSLQLSFYFLIIMWEIGCVDQISQLIRIGLLRFRGIYMVRSIYDGIACTKVYHMIVRSCDYHYKLLCFLPWYRHGVVIDSMFYIIFLLCLTFLICSHVLYIPYPFGQLRSE